MSENEDDSLVRQRDEEEILNALVWPGFVEEGLVAAHSIREMQGNEDRFSRNLSPVNPRSGPKPSGARIIVNMILVLAFLTYAAVLFYYIGRILLGG
jgi:hypothetical protein